MNIFAMRSSTIPISILLALLVSEIIVCESRRHGWGLPSSSLSSTSTSKVLCLATSRKGRRKPSSKGGGFGSQPPKIVNDNNVVSESNKPTTAKRIYSMPALYDLAFGYRNYEEEVDFLIGQYQALHSDGKPPTRVLELAAGPARHSIHALGSSKVQFATALDNSQEMVEYGKTIAAEELDVDSLDHFSYVQKDMSNFTMRQSEDDSANKFDSAWILLGSLQHLITNDQVIQCFKSIHNVLDEGGILVLELPHPRETFTMVECTKNGWEVPLEDENGQETGALEIIWGDDDDDFDEIKQIRQFTVAMNLKGVENNNADDQSVREIVPMRLFTTQEIDALARIAGFQVTSLHGALADGVDVNDEDEAFRLVCVLQKVKH